MDTDKFKTLLNDRHEWPCEYSFKFVVPAAKEEELIGLLPLSHLSKRPSKNGNFVSVTARRKLSSADECIAVYERVASIEGLISL